MISCLGRDFYLAPYFFISMFYHRQYMVLNIYVFYLTLHFTYFVQIIGHSMGAGIATILTYILRENEKLASSTCIAFGPGTALRSIVYFEQHKLRKIITFRANSIFYTLLACCHTTMSCKAISSSLPSAYPYSNFNL
jgi:hypothetical protein